MTGTYNHGLASREPCVQLAPNSEVAPAKA